MNRAASDVRNAATSAISAGSPARPIRVPHDEPPPFGVGQAPGAHGRVDHARADHVHPDVVERQVGGQSLAEHQHASP